MKKKADLIFSSLVSKGKSFVAQQKPASTGKNLPETETNEEHDMVNITYKNGDGKTVQQGVLTSYLSSMQQKWQNVDGEQLRNNFVQLEQSFKGVIEQSGIQDFTSKTYKAGADYIKSYQSLSSNMEHEASKDEFNMLIVKMQKLAKSKQEEAKQEPKSELS